MLTLLAESGAWTTLCIMALGAWLSLGAERAVDSPSLVALGLFVFLIYGLDRYRDPPEDRHERSLDIDPAAFVRRHRRAFRMALLVATAAQIALMAIAPRLVLRVAIALASTIFYIVRIPILGIRLKELPFFKNLYAPAVTVAYSACFMGIVPTRESLPMLGIATLLCAINGVAFDMKDIENDRRAGLVLLSTTLASHRVYALLVGAALLGSALSFFSLHRPWSVGAIAAFLTLAGIVNQLSRRFSRRLLFVWCDGVLAVPFLVWAAEQVI